MSKIEKNEQASSSTLITPYSALSPQSSSLPPLTQPSVLSPHHSGTEPAARSLEVLLQQEAGISEETLQKARERLGHGKELGETLQEMGALGASTWAQMVAAYYGLPYLSSLGLEEDTTQLLSRVPLNFARRYHLLPLKRQEEAILVAVADPRVLGALDDLRLLWQMPIRVVVAPLPVVQEAINR